MILSGKQIEAEIAAGRIVIDPYNPQQMNPNSYNLRLADKLLVYSGTLENPDSRILDMSKEEPVDEIKIPPEGLVLLPGVLYLGSTVEAAGSAHFVPCVEGRSSAGRLGLNIHQTAGFGDVGFQSRWCLELTVVHPVRIFANVEIAQVVFTTVYGDVVPYAGQYQHQSGPKPSGLWKDFRKEVAEIN